MKDNKLKSYYNNDKKYKKIGAYMRKNSKFSKTSSANTLFSKNPTPVSSSIDFNKMINKKPKNNKINPNNINIYNLGIDNIHRGNKKLNTAIKKDCNKNLLGSTDTITLPSNMHFQRNKIRKLTNVSNIRNTKYKLSYKNQNTNRIYSCRFSLKTYRKDAFGSIIKKNGKQKISFADNPFIQKSMNKSKSCPDIKDKKKKGINLKLLNENKNTKNNSDLAEVILIKSYKKINKMNMYGGRNNNGNNYDSELNCCSSFCNIF